MGYTTFTKQLVDKYISDCNPRTVTDLGAQNDFSDPNLPAPYISEWYKSKGIDYFCIDLNGENGASMSDLSKIFKTPWGWQADMVCDMGTSEHVGDNGKFGWEAIYNCWINKWNLLKEGGIMISENPETGNWPGHGFNYYTMSFYIELSNMVDFVAIELGRQAAMGNVTDGWNVFCVMQKTGRPFISLEQFKTLSLRQS